jgi:kynureninase
VRFVIIVPRLHTRSIIAKMTVTKAPKPVFPAEAASLEYAASLDAADPLRGFRDQFIIPSKANLATKKLAKPGETSPKM